MERINDIVAHRKPAAALNISFTPSTAGTLTATPSAIPQILQRFDFETDVQGWSVGGTAATKAVAQSTNWWSTGTGSLHLTGTNTSGQTHYATGPSCAVTVGNSYTASCDIDVITPGVTGARLRIDWYNGVSFLSSSATSYLTAAQETSLTVTATAPNSATLAYVVVSNEGTGSGELYVDNVKLALNTNTTFAVSKAPVGVPITFTGSITFYDTDRTVAQWFWDLGDGTTAVGQVATHTYRVPNPRTGVALVVTDDQGNRYTCRTQIYLEAIAYGNMQRVIVVTVP